MIRGFKMKKLSALLLLVIILIGTLMGCNQKDEFVKVASITYTFEGKSITEKSKAYLGLGEAEEITYEGYYSGTLSTYRLDDKPRSVYLSRDQKEVDNIQGLNDSHKGEYVYYYKQTGVREYRYYRAKLVGLYHSYVYVKVVDDDTIVISSSKGKTTYTVSSYSITEFSD